MRRPRAVAIPLMVCGILLLPACARRNKQLARVPQTPQPSPAPSARPPAALPQPLPVGYSEEGIASWYGIPYHGRHAADGEIYDMETLVAAHRIMPFNTWLKVTNLANSKSVNVRIIDRGPFVEGRILDLSKAAARQIDLLGPGVGRVRMEVITAPRDIPADDFYAVQVAAFAVYSNAERARMTYAQRYGAAQLALRQGQVPMWRLLVGKEPSVEAAQRLASTLSAENKDVFVVRLDHSVIPVPPNAIPPVTAPSAAGTSASPATSNDPATSTPSVVPPPQF